MVKTVQQVIGGAQQPPVTAPTVPAAPVGINALVNPTLTSTNPYVAGESAVLVAGQLRHQLAVVRVEHDRR